MSSVGTPPPDPPPNVNHVAATLAAAPAAAAAVHTTTVAPSSPASPAGSAMEQRRALRNKLLCMHEPDGTDVPPPASVTPPVTKAYETLWFESEGLDHINGSICDKEWGVKASNGLVLGPSKKEASAGMSRLNFFMLMFPPNHILKIFQLMNTQLARVRQKEKNWQEILKFFGISVLMTQFEFGPRVSLWSTFAPSKYVPAAHFEKTGMFCPRFDLLFRCIRFSDQPNRRPAVMSAEVYRSKLVDDFVKAFNLHRMENFIPGTLICMDESISRWYGGGRYWINEGLPCYTAIDCRPENGCEIQNSECGESGVMLRLKLVKTFKRKLKLSL